MTNQDYHLSERSFDDLAKEVGFVRSEWHKLDPRGEEYGRYVATREPNGFILLEHASDKPSYRMLFTTSADFRNFCKDHL